MDDHLKRYGFLTTYNETISVKRRGAFNPHHHPALGLGSYPLGNACNFSAVGQGMAVAGTAVSRMVHP